MTFAKYFSGEIDISWMTVNDDLQKALTEFLSKSATEAIAETIKDDLPWINLPLRDRQERGRRNDDFDPLMMEIWISALGATEDDGPIFRASIREVVMDVAEDDPEIAKKLSTALRSLADELDEGIKREEASEDSDQA